MDNVFLLIHSKGQCFKQLTLLKQVNRQFILRLYKIDQKYNLLVMPGTYKMFKDN